MDDIRYHPLVDADTDGEIKVPMFCTDRADNMKRHRFCLEEIVPHTFRLCSTKPLKDEETAFDIRCPYCGHSLKRISRSVDSTHHGLFICERCYRPR